MSKTYTQEERDAAVEAMRQRCLSIVTAEIQRARDLAKVQGAYDAGQMAAGIAALETVRDRMAEVE